MIVNDESKKKFKVIDGSDNFSDDEETEKKRNRLLYRVKKISILRLLPSVLTLLAMYFGFTSINFSIAGKFEFVVGLVFAAAFLDMMDGRVARFVGQESRFGAELDSLADFLNFGIAPAFAVWSWGLKDFGDFGWVLSFFFVVCCALRLARFNTQIEENVLPTKYFQGVPAPAGGLLILMPIILSFLELESKFILQGVMVISIICVGILMISRLPTISFKNTRFRLPRHSFILTLMIAAITGAMIFTFPFIALLILGLAYLISLPVTCFNYYYRNN